MLLSAVEVGRQFTIGGVHYTHDILGLNGGGKIAVRNLVTNEAKLVIAITSVKLVDVEVNEPVVLNPPQVEETEVPFSVEIPSPVELVGKVDEDVEDDNNKGKEEVSGHSPW